MNEIEVKGLNIESKRDLRIVFPAQIKESKYVGPINGYFVENTNVYNVIPIDAPEAILNDSRIGQLGYILPINPYKYTEANVRVKYLGHQSEGTTESILDTLRKSINSEDCTTKEADSGREKVETASSKYTLSSQFGPDLAGAIAPQEPSIFEQARDWVASNFINGEDKSCTSHKNQIVGFWEDDKLHFVRFGLLSHDQEIQQEAYSLKLDVFSRNTGILESDVMLKKGAIFIGCGSVGGLFALELARAGVGRFMLIDSDTIGYHNICRHQCGILDVGKFKTDAVKERILQINPYAEVVTKNMTIQDVPLDELLAFCDKNTIVIGGADNREGDLYANGIALQVGMPFMSIGCWERAFAGEIFYCLPKGMPTYQDFMEVAGHMSARVSQNRRFYTTEEELAKITFEPGISADINFVTTIAVKLALDILNLDNENYTQRLLPHLTQYTLVCNTNNPKIGGEMAEIFSYPLQITTSIVVPYSKK